jgi:hypothetical protein
MRKSSRSRIVACAPAPGNAFSADVSWHAFHNAIHSVRIIHDSAPPHNTREKNTMPNDAKFGLIVGVVLVIAVAVLFFQSQPPEPARPAPVEVQAPAIPPSAAALQPSPAPPVRPTHETKGQMTSRIQE